MGEALKADAGIDLLHVPYRGDSAIQTAMLTGEVQAAFLATTSALTLIESGGGRAVAIAGTERVPALPSVPTFAEAGFPNLSVGSTYGVLAPVGTPPAVMARLGAALSAAARAPEVQERMRGMNLIPVGGDPAAYAESIRRQTRFWDEVITKAGLTNLE